MSDTAPHDDAYPYDDDVLERVTRLLTEAIPAMYRVPDEPPAGRGELHRFVEVVAAPLAVLWQNVEELQADLFIDTAHDRMIPYLAEMVGTNLVFPDADSNRRDVRGTVAWRRRKGTPAALEEMGSELTGQPVVLQEGWKRVLLAQDLDLLRPERVAIDLCPAVVAEQVTGPLDAVAHAVDVRAISASTGRRHPRHIAHWVHPTATFPLRGATSVDLSVPPDSDVRFAMHPLGGRHALRARRAAGEVGPFTDRIPEQHFAAAPDRWFGRDGGFTIEVCGLPAGIAGSHAVDRVASTAVASDHLGRGVVTTRLLDHPSRGWRGGVAIELGLVGVTGPAGGVWTPDPTTFTVRSRIELDGRGVISVSSPGGPGPAGTQVPMVRLRALGGAPGRFVPGAHLEVASTTPGAAAAAPIAALAREGFLRGALHLHIPALEVRGERLLHVAADGSLYEAAEADGTPLEMPASAGGLRLDPAALLVAGPGAAWPPLAPVAEPRMLNRVPAAPGRGPTVLHGATVVRRTGDTFDPLPGGVACALTFAAQIEHPGGADFVPFVQLSWTGADPTTATWSPLDPDALPLGAAAGAAAYAAVARRRELDPGAVALAVRFESTDAAASACPGEVAFTADDGRTVLVHLPQLDVAPVDPAHGWPAVGGAGFASAPVRVAEDGSTWASDSTAGRRLSSGAVAPIGTGVALRRRQVHGRRLCAWSNEDWTASPPETLALTEPGRLDIDVTHGLFAMSATEPPQPWTPRLGTTDGPPSVTTGYEEGATTHIGARPAAREPVLDLRLAPPTRLVARAGALHPDAPAAWHDIPRYESLAEALAAVSTRWQALTMPEVAAVDAPLAEVIQFEDSATYPEDALVWPSGPTDPLVRAAAQLDLTIQAAERERPVVLVDAAAGWDPPAAGTTYTSLTLRGIALGGEGWTGATVPPSATVAVELCSVLHGSAELRFADVTDGAEVTVRLCETAGLVLDGSGHLRIADSIVDAPGVAIEVPSGTVELDRVSVGGEVAVMVLEASEVIFADDVEVEDRFRGCVRFSRVTGASVLPRVHRVTVDTPVRTVAHNRLDAAWWRLSADCDPAITTGAEDGSEMGAFRSLQLSARMAGFTRRLQEHTPAGFTTGIIRID